MSNEIISKYPYTDLHSVNLDYILKIVRENAGLHLEVSGNQLLMKTADNTIISAITIPYATEAGSANTAVSAGYASQAGSAASAQYAATSGTATTATNATNATHAASADTATSATSATSATNADHATNADSATYATSAGSAASAAYAETTGSVEHALYAIESVNSSDNLLVFTKNNGSKINILTPFASKSARDSSNNIITSTYIANVVDNSGTLEFKNASGETVVSITPSVQVADQDSYGNTIADFIKTITQASGSNYLTVSTGTGATDTITINYANTAWKDTNGNVIKNTYIKRLEIITDPNDGHKKLVAYNGDDPEAELFRFEIEAYSAQVAAEATHAASADYATSAGSAATAATSTGSISSISTPANENDSFTINNGDGTTKKIDIHNKSIIEINLYGDGIKTNPPDLAVNASEDYEVDTDDLSKYRYISDISDVIEPNINFVYNEQSGGLVIFNAISQQTTISGNTAIILSVFNGTSIVVLQIEKSNTDGYITITRLL